MQRGSRHCRGICLASDSTSLSAKIAHLPIAAQRPHLPVILPRSYIAVTAAWCGQLQAWNYALLCSLLHLRTEEIKKPQIDKCPGSLWHTWMMLDVFPVQISLRHQAPPRSLLDCHPGPWPETCLYFKKIHAARPHTHTSLASSKSLVPPSWLITSLRQDLHSLVPKGLLDTSGEAQRCGKLWT